MVHTKSLFCSGLVLMFLFLASTADAQYRNRYKRHGSKLDIRLGMRAGIVNSNFGGDEFLVEFDSNNLDVYPAVNYDNKTGYMAGIYADMRMSDRFYFQPEINWVQMGTTMTRDIDLSNEDGAYIVTQSASVSQNVQFITIEQRLNYLQIPLMARIPINRSLYVNVGPQISFKIGENRSYGTTSLDSIPSDFPFILEGAPSTFKNGDLGAIAGLSLQLRNGLNLNIRYNRNFRNINRNEGLDILTVEPKNINKAFMFSLGYTFLYDKRLKEDISRRH